MSVALGRHRQYPKPDGPWLMRQTWRDLLFAHWPVPTESLRPVVPAELPIDTIDGTAWIAIVPFRGRDTRIRWLPPVPTATTFPELNVRTYVTLDGRPGVYFFSLDAASVLAVIGARLIPLSYFHARMSKTLDGEGWVGFSSERAHPGAADATFRARYRPAGPVAESTPGSLESWLTDRFCLYTRHPVAGLLRVDIDHAVWPLQPAHAEFSVNRMTEQIGVALPDGEPLLHFARRLDAFFWPPRRVAGDQE